MYMSNNIDELAKSPIGVAIGIGIETYCLIIDSDSDTDSDPDAVKIPDYIRWYCG
jgi:hypothetical protein